MNLSNISEVKILNIVASASADNMEDKVNKILADGWMLIDISTMGAPILAGKYNKDNYFTYHFGRIKIEDKVEI